MNSLTTSVQHCTGGSSMCNKGNQTNKKKNMHTDGKVEIKPSLLTDDLIFI